MAAIAEASPPAAAAPPSPETKDAAGGLKSEVRQLVDLLSKLNPSAKEFFPSAAKPKPVAPAPAVAPQAQSPPPKLSADAPEFVVPDKDSGSEGSQNGGRRRRSSFGQGRRRINERTKRAEREESIRRTVYVSDIDHTVTEEKLAEAFAECGQVVDCRICGDPHSVLRFAFIEFSDEDGAKAALTLCGAVLGYYPVRVLPSKTAILPVNPKFLPRTEDEKEMVVRTVYCTNIDKKVTQLDVKNFFEHLCGEVSRLRLLGDNVHSTRIAFVEFVRAESAIVALNCSGTILGTLPIRVSPSKTPVRPRVPRLASSN